MARRSPDPFALHLGCTVHRALGNLFPPLEAPSPTAPSERRTAALVVWRLMRTLPRELDEKTLTDVLRQVMRAGYEAGRKREALRIARLAEKNQRIDDATRDVIIRMVEQREPAKCIAGKLGIGTRTVEREIRRLQDDGLLPARRVRRKQTATR